MRSATAHPGRPIAALGLLGALVLLALSSTAALAAGPPFPSPSATQSIYDPDHLLRPATLTTAETAADSLVSGAGVRPIIYVERSPEALSAAQAGRNADTLIRQWNVGPGLVMLIDVGTNGCGGHVSVRRRLRNRPGGRRR